LRKMNKEKHVDESWKEQATQEKDELAHGKDAQDSGQPSGNAPSEDSSGPTENQEQAVEVNFLNYVTSLGFQAMIFMGEIPNPVTEKVEKNLPQAKFLIDTLAMLKEKTEGNLNDQEKMILENSVYELQMKYVQILSAEEPEGEGT